MQFTVEQVRSVRNNYLEPPYPGFCLEEVVRRRRSGQTKLVRGENAWVAKGAADSEKEWVQRLVQSTLNKLTPKNNDMMLEKLRTREIFHKSDITAMVVGMIFKKALDEPENAKLYAGVCLSLALFESAEVNAITDGERPQSNLRDAIISAARQEFKGQRDEVADADGASEEELEFIRTNIMRRKRSNMNFIGELYLCTALTATTMFQIIKATIKLEESSKYPSSDNIDLFIALLTTAGEKLDSTHRKDLDPYFVALADLIKRDDCPYPHRIRFKIMDMLDLRKSGWGAKPKVAKPAAASSSNQSKDSGKKSAAPAAKKGGRDFGESGGFAKNWRDTPSANQRPAGGRTASPAGPGKGLNGRGTAAASSSGNGSAEKPSTSAGATSAAFRGSSAPEVPLVKFELRVASMLQEWVADRTNDVILHWVEQFNTCDRVFESESELCVAVALEVIKSACLTTRKDAQREAFSFLVVGLFMTDTEVFGGFAGALATAIEDGVLEDVPKFGERFMSMLRLTSTEQETRADVYFDAANVLRLTYNQLEEPDDFAIDTLLSFWERVPHPSTEEEYIIRMDVDVVFNVCNPEGAQPGLEKLLSRIIHSMVEMELTEPGVLEEFLDLDVEEGLCRSVIEDYKIRYLR